MSPRKPNLQLIYVSDIGLSQKFYEKIFEEKPIFVSPRYVAFSAGKEALFALWTGGDKPKAVDRYSEIGIMLSSEEEVKALHQKWKTDPEIVFFQELKKEVFGPTFLIKDPDGHLIRVCLLDNA